MTGANASTAATYFDCATAASHDVVLIRVADESLQIRGDGVSRDFAVSDATISPPLARTRRVVMLRGGGELHCDDDAFLERSFPPSLSQRALMGMERLWPISAIAALLVVAAALSFVKYGVPALANRVAAEVSPSVELALGEQVLAAFDSSGFDASETPAARQASLRAAFDRFVEKNDFSPLPRVEFRQWFGAPNAFALPGGIVVVTDDLVARLRNDDQFLAVIAHELGHVRGRHALRATLQNSAVLIAASFMTGDVSSLSGLTVAVPAFLLGNHYSQEFEAEADRVELASLRAHGTSTLRFAEVLRILDDFDDNDDPAAVGYLSSHPSSASRIAAAEASASNEPKHGSGASREQVVDRDLEGCWVGQATLEDGTMQRWRVQRGADGSLVVSLRVRRDTGSERSIENGTWSYQGEVLTHRIKTIVPLNGEQVAGDWQHRYTIESLRGDTLRYRQLPHETIVVVTRVTCNVLLGKGA